MPDRCDVVEASVALLSELETSLRASQKALLSQDAAGVEWRTQEQRRLQQALEVLWSPAIIQTSGREFSRPPASAPPAHELREAQARVLHLGRVQMVLLERAQRFLETFSRLLAGPGASYAPSARTVATWQTVRAKEAKSCRA